MLFSWVLNIQSVQLCVEFFIGHWRKISFLKLYLIDFFNNNSRDILFLKTTLLSIFKTRLELKIKE